MPLKISKFLSNLLVFTPPDETLPFYIGEKEDKIIYDVRENQEQDEVPEISDDYEKNKSYLEKRFSYPDNDDVVIKEIELADKTRAFIIFYDGMCDGKLINNGIVKPLLEIPLFED